MQHIASIKHTKRHEHALCGESPLGCHGDEEETVGHSLIQRGLARTSLCFIGVNKKKIQTDALWSSERSFIPTAGCAARLSALRPLASRLSPLSSLLSHLSSCVTVASPLLVQVRRSSKLFLLCAIVCDLSSVRRGSCLHARAHG